MIDDLPDILGLHGLPAGRAPSPFAGLRDVVDQLLAPRGPDPGEGDDPEPPPSPPPGPATPDALEWAAIERLLAEVCTGLWRMRRLMVEPDDQQPAEATRRPFRHLQALQDSLAGAGLAAIDHTGAAYDPGMSLTIVACEQRSGIAHDRIIETLRPTVTHHGRRIQVGEVILAIPRTDENDEPQDPTP